MRALLSLALLILSMTFASCRPNASREAPLVAVQGPHIRFQAAGEGEVTALVRHFELTALREGRVPLVYVGATWCEPCRYFHEAAERGELDGELPAMSLLEFDQDRDGARLAAAGYLSRMIPLFVVPGEHGSASERRIEGSIHGPGSPLQIAPRLRAILAP